MCFYTVLLYLQPLYKQTGKSKWPAYMQYQTLKLATSTVFQFLIKNAYKQFLGAKVKQNGRILLQIILRLLTLTRAALS